MQFAHVTPPGAGRGSAETMGQSPSGPPGPHPAPQAAGGRALARNSGTVDPAGDQLDEVIDARQRLQDGQRPGSGEAGTGDRGNDLA